MNCSFLKVFGYISYTSVICIHPKPWLCVCLNAYFTLSNHALNAFINFIQSKNVPIVASSIWIVYLSVILRSNTGHFPILFIQTLPNMEEDRTFWLWFATVIIYLRKYFIYIISMSLPGKSCKIYTFVQRLWPLNREILVF